MFVWMAGWLACPNKYFFYFHFFKAFGIDVIIFYFKILKKKIKKTCSTFGNRSKDLGKQFVKICVIFTHENQGIFGKYNCKCIAKKSLNRSLKDLTKSGISPGKNFHTAYGNRAESTGKKKGKKNKLSLRKGR